MKNPTYWKTYPFMTDVLAIEQQIQHTTFRSRGLNLHLISFEQAKDAANILVIPATGCYALNYASVCYHMYHEGFNVFCFDYQGHGESEGRRGDFTITELVENSHDAATFIVQNQETNSGMR